MTAGISLLDILLRNPYNVRKQPFQTNPGGTARGSELLLITIKARDEPVCSSSETTFELPCVLENRNHGNLEDGGPGVKESFSKVMPDKE
jgi:hypothetical protein